MDERLEEQASLYALGALPADETPAFEEALRRDPELRRLVAALRNATAALAGTAAPVSPPPALKQRILDEIDRREKVIPLTQPVAPASRAGVWFAWATAACFVLFCGILLNDRHNLDARIAQLDRMVDQLAEDTNNLHQSVLALTRQNQIANLRIAMMESTVADSPKAAAVALWNEKDQTGVLVVKNLKQLPADRDYELWVFDAAKPVAAGLVQVDAAGNQRVTFKAHAHIQNTGNFAITEEPKGGGEAPRGSVVLAGGSL